MSDKRVPSMTFLLRFHGKEKSLKVEVFPASQFPITHDNAELYRKTGKCRRGFDRPGWYRLRVGGQWFPWKPKPKKKYILLDKWDIRDLVWRSISAPLDKADYDLTNMETTCEPH